jgi:hypothetical protein
MFKFHQDIEAKIASSGIPASVLRPGGFYSSFLFAAEAIRAGILPSAGRFNVYRENAHGVRSWVSHQPFGIFLALYRTGGGFLSQLRRARLSGSGQVPGRYRA